jgi:hypothetical protein
MVKKAMVILLAMVVVAFLAAAVGATDSTEEPDEPIKFEPPEGAEKEIIVEFDHELHGEYGCVECHHEYRPNDKGEYPKDRRGQYDEKPENTWEPGETVKPCIECHELEPDRKKQREMLQNPEMVRSFEDAMHDNCQSCHKDYNRENKLRGDDALPSTCTDCHG